MVIGRQKTGCSSIQLRQPYEKHGQIDLRSYLSAAPKKKPPDISDAGGFLVCAHHT